MSISYRKKYLKIYLWQILSISLGFLSLFIVMPSLSSNKVLFGIYSVCSSLTIFFSYADLGFISSGQKYAAEYFIQNDIENEIKTIGFTAFIMISVFSFLAFIFILFSIFPNVIIPELIINSTNYYIARQLLLIIALSCPIIIFQRVLNMIYTIRVEDYKFQRINVVGSILKISSVFYFFNGRYLIVEYMLFLQIVNLGVVIIGLVKTIKYGYSFISFVKSLKFDKTIYQKEKMLTFTSLVMTLSWILFYELDQIFISRTIGIEGAATFGVALSVLTLIRTYISILYSPYTSRFNHYSGLKDDIGLMDFTNKIIKILSPFVILPLIGCAFLIKPFVSSWVGNQYSETSQLIAIMIFCFTPCFLTNPISSYFIARCKVKTLLRYNVFLPIIYWIGIIFTYKNGGLNSFAFFKGFTPILLSVFMWFIAKKEFKLLKGNIIQFKDIIYPLIIPIIFITIVSYLINPLMKYEKNNIDLAINIIIMGFIIGIAIIISILGNRELRDKVLATVRRK